MKTIFVDNALSLFGALLVCSVLFFVFCITINTYACFRMIDVKIRVYLHLLIPTTYVICNRKKKSKNDAGVSLYANNTKLRNVWRGTLSSLQFTPIYYVMLKCELVNRVDILLLFSVLLWLVLSYNGTINIIGIYCIAVYHTTLDILCISSANKKKLRVNQDKFEEGAAIQKYFFIFITIRYCFTFFFSYGTTCGNLYEMFSFSLENIVDIFPDSFQKSTFDNYFVSGGMW